VINFITRRNYQGYSITGGADVTQEGGGNIYHASLLGGWGDLDADGWNVWAAVNVKQNRILRGNQRDFANSFQPERGLSPDTRGTPFANVVSGTGSLIGSGLKDPDTNLTKTTIGVLDLPGGAGCAAGGDMIGPYDDKVWASPGASFGCAWDYGRARTIQQPVDTVQAIGRATFKINDDHEFFAELMASKVSSTRQFEAQQISSSVNASATQLDAYELNATTQATYDAIYDQIHDYFGDQANLVYGRPITYRWRCTACGPRQLETTTKAYRLLFGMTGVLGNWDYDVGLSRAQSRAETVLAGGYFYTPQLKAALKSGLLNPFLMPGQDQSQAAYEALAAADASGLLLYRGVSTTTTLDASFSGSLGFKLWGEEDVKAAAGFDVRREEYEFNGPSDWSRGNAFVFGAPGDASNYMSPKTRNVKAVFAEFNLPVVDSLEVNLAVRHDRYDGFGGTTNPKYSFKWQPIDWLAVRGAYSTGFKVPDFAKLFRGITETQYTGLDLADPAVCPNGRYNPDVAECSVQIRPDIVTGGNPNLKPIMSNNIDVGLEWYFMPKSLLGMNLYNMNMGSYVTFGSSQAQFYNQAVGKITTYNMSAAVNTKARVRGVELQYVQDLGNGFGLNANYTYADGKETGKAPKSACADLGDCNMVGTSKNSYNLGVFFENSQFSARVNYSFRSAFLNGLDRNSAIYQDDVGTLSAAFNYNLSENLTLSLEGKDLNNPTLKSYATTRDQPRAFYKNGKQLFFGVRGKM